MANKKQKKSGNIKKDRLTKIHNHLNKLTVYLGIFALAVSAFGSAFAFTSTLFNDVNDISEAGVICPSGFTWNGSACTQTNTTAASCPAGATGPNGAGQCSIPASIGDIYWRCEDYAIEPGYNHVQVQIGVDQFEIDDHDIDQTQSWLCNANKEVNLVALNGLNTQIAWVCSGLPLPTGYNYVYVFDGSNFNTQANSVDVNSAAAGCSGSWSLAAQGAVAQQIAWYCSGLAPNFTPVKGIMPDGNIDGTIPDIDTACGDKYLGIANSLAETAASTTAATCPAGYTLSGATCTQTLTQGATGYEVDNASVGTGTCTPSTVYQRETIGTCTFPLTGSPTGTYQLPAQGLFAGVREVATDATTFQGNSDACTVSGTTMTCTNLPTGNATPGEKHVVIHQPTVAWFADKGRATILERDLIDANSTQDGTCVPNSFIIGNTTDCTFPLTGASNNQYELPAGGITASISGATGSSSCTLTGNGTAAAALECLMIPSNGTSVGSQTAAPDIAGEDSSAPLTILPTDYTLTLNDIGDSSDCTSTTQIDIGDTYSCTFPVTFPQNSAPSLPTGGFQAATSTDETGTTPLSSGFSPDCSYNTQSNELVCDGIPSGNGTEGVRNVLLRETDQGTPEDKGDVELVVLDADGDGIPDRIECTDSNNCEDTDGDGTPDFEDTDSDGDGIPDEIERGDSCSDPLNCVPVDTDGDGTPDYQDTDSDGDGIPDEIERGDNCETLTDCTPVDTDGDGTPDYRDLDSDGDTIPDSVEKGSSCTSLDNCTPQDTDNDGTPDYLDLDSDNDGIPDRIEASCSVSITFLSVTATAQSLVDTPCDTDGDGTPDFRDGDSDNDGLIDTLERGSTCQTLDNCTPVDSDGNGIPDFRQAQQIVTVRSGGVSFAIASGLVAAFIGGYFYIQTRKNKIKA